MDVKQNQELESNTDSMNIQDQKEDQQTADIYPKGLVCLKNEISDTNCWDKYLIIDEVSDNFIDKYSIDCDLSLSETVTNFDPNEVMERMRTLCKSYCAETNDAKRKSIFKQTGEYLSRFIPTICKRMNAEVLEAEPNTLLLKSPAIAFGDIHGNFDDLLDIETKFWKSKKTNNKYKYIFLGDFVDRGSHSVEVALYLLLLKMTEPSKFLLIRGNHEVRRVNKVYTFFSECNFKFGEANGLKVWDLINSCFERLPIAAVIDKKIFCCHGGVPKSVKTMTELNKFQKPLVDPDPDYMGIHELLWNDPIESSPNYSPVAAQTYKENNTKFIDNTARSTGYYFTEAAVDEFFKANNFSFMIRAHESVFEGFKYHFESKAMTVFSSSNYSANNSSGCAKIDSSSEIPVGILLKKGGSQVT